jgi:hypothetical protein
MSLVFSALLTGCSIPRILCAAAEGLAEGRVVFELGEFIVMLGDGTITRIGLTVLSRASRLENSR